YFLHRFALRGANGPYNGAEALRTSLAHQNPLLAIALTPNQSAPLSAPSKSFFTLSAPNVVLTAFKPAEEGERGVVARLWELTGQATALTLDASAFNPNQARELTLIETDAADAGLNAGVITDSIDANEIKAYRFDVGPLAGTFTPAPTATATPAGSIAA